MKYDYRLEVMSFTKKSLLELDKMKYCYWQVLLVSLPRPTTIDFSHLKSLSKFLLVFHSFIKTFIKKNIYKLFNLKKSHGKTNIRMTLAVAK